MHGVERLLELVHEGRLGGAADQVHEHFGVGVGVEDRAFVLQLATQRHAVGEVSVVPQRHVAVVEPEDERLDVVGGARSGGGITHVADRLVAGEPSDLALVAEHLGQQSEAAVPDEMAVVVGDDAGAFLTAVLQCVESEIRQAGGVRVTPYAEDAAFFVNVFEFS